MADTSSESGKPQAQRDQQSAGGSTIDKHQDATGTAIANSAEEQSTENFIETYHAIAEWIRFADAKAAVILTIGGALAGFLIPTIHLVIEDSDAKHLVPFWREVTFGCFAIYLLFFLVSGVYAFLCINPISNRGKHPSLEHCSHFHPAAIAAAYGSRDVARFVQDCDQMGAKKMKGEVQAAVLLDSHISNKKYGRVKASLLHFGISVFFGFAYFLISQL